MRAPRSNSSIPRSTASVAVLGLDRPRIRLVRENEFARVIARPHRRRHRFDQGAHGGGVFELLLVATGEFGEFVLDPADLPQPQDRAAAGHLAFGFDDATGERGHRHGEGDAARAQSIDRTLHVAGGLRLEPGAEGEDALRRFGGGDQRGIADDFGLVAPGGPGDENLLFGEQERIGAIDRGPRGGALVA